MYNYSSIISSKLNYIILSLLANRISSLFWKFNPRSLDSSMVNWYTGYKNIPVIRTYRLQEHTGYKNISVTRTYRVHLYEFGTIISIYVTSAVLHT